MKKFFSICILMMSLCIVTMAQDKVSRNEHQGARPSFEQFMNEKIQFMLNEMKLPAADSAKFVPLYKELQQAKGELMRKHGGMREVMVKIRRNEAVADSLYTKVVMNEAELQVADAELERQYLEKFSHVLTPKQLYSYQEANRKFKNTYMNRPRNGQGNHRQPR